MRDTAYDLVVIGSGAAGLAAALTAAREGASVIVLEASDKIGGATAFSGALLWAPANRWQRAAGFEDSKDTARAYIDRALGARAQDKRWDVFLDRVNPVIEQLLVEESGLSLVMNRYPDAFGEWPEGRDSRHLSANPFPLSALAKEWLEKIRPPANPSAALLTFADCERVGWIAPTAPKSLVRLLPTVLGNVIGKRRAMGFGFVCAMTAACLRRGVRIDINSRVTDLVVDRGRVIGVVAATADGAQKFSALKGVVLAAGGFSWQESARAQFLAGPYELPQDPPTNTGDSLRLAQSVGAQLSALDEAWNLPSAPMDVLYMGASVGQPLVADRMLPHQIWVNKQGRRFVNEASQNAAEAFAVRDDAGGLINYPCFNIFDQNYRKKYRIYMKHDAGSNGPPDLVRADSLPELAAKIGVDANGLVQTVTKYNAMAVAGRDTLFGRGEGAYERYFTGNDGSLGPIKDAPFFALPVYSGGVGTKGGAMTDEQGRVLSTAGAVIEGLFAAGNASAAFNGPITVAAGCTIPPALVMGNVSALSALGRAAF